MWGGNEGPSFLPRLQPPRGTAKTPSAIQMIAIDQLFRVRELYAGLIDGLTEEELFRVPDGFSNHIAWNVAHTVVTQQILHYRLANLEPRVPAELIEAYKKGTGPATADPESYRAVLGYLHRTPEYLKEDYEAGRFSRFTEYETSTGIVLRTIDDAIAYNHLHEGIHLGYVMGLKRAVRR